MSGSRIPARRGAAVPPGPNRRQLASGLVGTPGPTGLNHASATSGNACRTPSGVSQSLQQMNVRTLFSMSTADRRDWYIDRLSAYDSNLDSSAACNVIPKQLVATTLLNELADINWQDVWQQRLGLGGSLGIAQIQVETALTHGLLDFPGDQELLARRSLECANNSRHGICLRDADDLRRGLIEERLAIPQFAIEAAARELAKIVEHMSQNLSNPWQQKFGFSLTQVNRLRAGNDLYNYLDGNTQREKEVNLAHMIIAAYNSPDIVIAQNAASIDRTSSNCVYFNGTIHGENGGAIAGELFDMSLFH